MSDLISRQAAIELILSGKVGDDSLVECPEECNSFLEWAAEAVGNMPSAERKKGRWQEDPSGYGFWICSACGFVSEASGADLLYNFCPNCGADMRAGEGERDETD